MSEPELPAWLSAMLPFEHTFTEVGEFTMHAMTQGRGLPVVLVHGNPTWGFLWRKVALALKNEPLEVHMPDLIGLGLSGKPRDARFFTIERHAEALGRYLDARVNGPFVLAVQDWGGAIGTLAASRRAERLKGLVVLNTVLGPPKPNFRPTLFHRSARWPLVSDIAFRLFNFPQGYLGRAQGDPSSISGDVRRAYLWPLRQNNLAPLALARMVPNSLTHHSVPALQEVHRFAQGFTGPTELVWGKRDPILGRMLKRTRELLPHARVTETEAGHFLQEEVPDEIAAAIKRVALAAGR